MALRKIVTVGDPILTKVCRPVTRFDQKLAILIEDMIETMHNANGVGLAGPQVGVMRRLCVVDTGEEDVELVNPEVVEPADGSVIQQAEACLLAARGIRVFNFSHAVIIVARSPQKGKDNRKDGNKSISVHRCSFFSYSVRRFLYVLP